MEQRTFHGPISIEDIAEATIAEFDRGDFKVQKVGHGENILVQIATKDHPRSGGTTALSIYLSKVEDGVRVELGEQAWLGLAASLGKTAFWALRNPFTLLGHLDDLAQDISSLQLKAKVWETIERVADAVGASHEISLRLRRLACQYCLTANPVGEPHCIACGAPLGLEQPMACPQCGFILPPDSYACSECGYKFAASS
jgi:hypothetical protein